MPSTPATSCKGRTEAELGHLDWLSKGYWAAKAYIHLGAFKSDTRCSVLRFSKRHPSGELGGIGKDTAPAGEGMSQGPRRPQSREGEGREREDYAGKK